MRRTWLFQCVVVVACCIGITGCTTSQWVTDSRKEVIPEASATTIRPILEISPLSQERPELLVKLSKQLEGPLEVQEYKHEQIKTIWGNSLLNVGIASLAFPVSPIYLVMRTLQGEPGDGVSGVVNTFLAATGFNAMEGSMFHISEQRGESKIERTPMGKGTRTEPWQFGLVEVKADGQVPVKFQANQTGHVTIDLKKIPSQLSHRVNDLALSISPTEGTVTAAEFITVPVSTMVAWEQKEAARAKLEEEKKAQWERDRPARETRERAAQARAAEEERRASIKAAAEARAYEQEQARKKEQDAREASAAMEALLGMGQQVLQNKADRAQAQYGNQQRLLQAQQEQQRRVQEQQRTAGGGSPGSARSEVRDYPAPDRNECLEVVSSTRGEQCAQASSSRIEMKNICPEEIKMQLCLWDSRRGQWQCGASTGRSGEMYLDKVSQSVCESDGRYIYAGCSEQARQGRFRNGNCGGNPNNEGKSSFIVK